MQKKQHLAVNVLLLIYKLYIFFSLLNITVISIIIINPIIVLILSRSCHSCIVIIIRVTNGIIVLVIRSVNSSDCLASPSVNSVSRSET